MENLALGLQLIVVGMSTVFSILLILIYGSKALIALINRIAPEEESKTKKSSSSGGSIDASTMQLLEKAVAEITAGKGKISKVEKI